MTLDVKFLANKSWCVNDTEASNGSYTQGYVSVLRLPEGTPVNKVNAAFNRHADKLQTQGFHELVNSALQDLQPDIQVVRHAPPQYAYTG